MGSACAGCEFKLVNTCEYMWIQGSTGSILAEHLNVVERDRPRLRVPWWTCAPGTCSFFVFSSCFLMFSYVFLRCQGSTKCLKTIFLGNFSWRKFFFLFFAKFEKKKFFLRTFLWSVLRPWPPCLKPAEKLFPHFSLEDLFSKISSTFGYY